MCMCVYGIGVGVGSVDEMCLARSRCWQRPQRPPMAILATLGSVTRIIPLLAGPKTEGVLSDWFATPETLSQHQRNAILTEWRSMGPRDIKLGPRPKVTSADLE